MTSSIVISAVFAVLTVSASDHPFEAPGVTSLTNGEVKYRVPDEHYVVLKRGPATAVIVRHSSYEDLHP